MPADRFFPLGVFEDGNLVDPAGFEAMIDDLSARGLDTVLFTNNWVARQAGLLDISDRRGFNVIFAPARELGSRWWRASVPTDIRTARRVIWPIVDELAHHPSLKGYSIADEPTLDLADKLALAVQAFKERDPSRPAIPTLIGLYRAEVLFDIAQPSVMLIDVYPVGWSNPTCDFTMTGFGYEDVDFVSYVRAITRPKPAKVPLWFILQTHRFVADTPILREPVRQEIRLQHWLAIGEGAQGIFWFIYRSQQGWRGLVDNPPLFQEVTALTRRVSPLRGILSELHKSSDQFQVTGSDAPYISTLANDDGSRLYAVVANRDCSATRELSIFAPNRRGLFRDLENGQRYAIGAPITFRPGDGRIFEFVPEGTGV